MALVADYTHRISPAALKAAGVVGACRYLSRSAWKVIGRAEYDELRAAGIKVVLNFEDEAAGWLGGAAAGAADAVFAAKAAKALGYPAGSPIPSSADFDMTAAQWAGPGQRYAAAYRDGLHAAGYEPGVYGPSDVLGWCRSVGYRWFWQAGMSTAWSGGRNAAPWPGAHLRQRRHQTIGGVDTDLTDLHRPDWAGTGDDLSAQTEIDVTYLAPRVEALKTGVAKIRSGPEAGQTMWAVQALNDLKATGQPVTLSPEDRAALVAALPSAADVAAHLDVAALAAAVAAHIKVT